MGLGYYGLYIPELLLMLCVTLKIIHVAFSALVCTSEFERGEASEKNRCGACLSQKHISRLSKSAR